MSDNSWLSPKRDPRVVKAPQATVVHSPMKLHLICRQKVLALEEATMRSQVGGLFLPLVRLQRMNNILGKISDDKIRTRSLNRQ